MKRDMELIRSILLATEEKPDDFHWTALSLPGRSADEVSSHIQLLTEAGYLSGKNYGSMDNPNSWEVQRLTWEGHEFLDAIKNDTVWNSVKATIKEKGGAIPVELLKAVAVHIAKGLFGIG